jgi:hypothetical protein
LNKKSPLNAGYTPPPSDTEVPAALALLLEGADNPPKPNATSNCCPYADPAIRKRPHKIATVLSFLKSTSANFFLRYTQ